MFFGKHDDADADNNDADNTDADITDAKYVLRVEKPPGSPAADLVSIMSVFDCTVMVADEVPTGKNSKKLLKFAGPIVIAEEESTFELKWALNQAEYRRFQKITSKWLTNYMLVQQSAAIFDPCCQTDSLQLLTQQGEDKVRVKCEDDVWKFGIDAAQQCL